MYALISNADYPNSQLSERFCLVPASLDNWGYTIHTGCTMHTGLNCKSSKMIGWIFISASHGIQLFMHFKTFARAKTYVDSFYQKEQGWSEQIRPWQNSVGVWNRKQSINRPLDDCYHAATPQALTTCKRIPNLLGLSLSLFRLSLWCWSQDMFTSCKCRKYGKIFISKLFSWGRPTTKIKCMNSNLRRTFQASDFRV